MKNIEKLTDEALSSFSLAASAALENPTQENIKAEEAARAAFLKAEAFEDSLALFLYNAKKLDAGSGVPTLENLTTEEAGKWIRVVNNKGPSRSVFGFVNPKTGDIHKAASWKAPAKTPRGNLFENGGLGALYPSGHPYAGNIRYMR